MRLAVIAVRTTWTCLAAFCVARCIGARTPHTPVWFIAWNVALFVVVWAVVFHRLSRIGRGLAALAWVFLISLTTICLMNALVPG